MTPEKRHDHRNYRPEAGGVNFKLRSLAQYPDYLEALAKLNLQTGPAFLRYFDETEWKALVEQFTKYQFLMVSGNDLYGAAFTLPLYWNRAVESLPTTINAVIMRAIGCCQRKEKVNTLVVLALVSDDRHHGNGWKTEFLTTLKHLASEKGFTSVLAPVRPSRKCEYPLMPFGQYVGWRQADGAPFDPDLRAHWNLGAVFLGAMPQAMTIEGKVKEWERWTGIRLTESGEYIVDGAQRPVIIDQTNDLGYYTDPNIWMLHRT
jgi:hypothetical protein